MNNYCVYKHTFPNGKVYIGITSIPIEKRFEGGRGYRKCPKMNNAILKYGWNNVEHEMLYSGLSKEDAEAKEIELIAFYGSVENGYNTDHGGNTTGTHSIETREKISAGNKGKPRPQFSEERKLQYSKMMQGENNPFFGKHHSEVTKTEHSNFMKGNQYNKGHHHTESFKAIKSEQMKEKYADGNNPRSKAVVSVDLKGSKKNFGSLRIAAKSIGVSPATMLKYISTGNELCGRFWRYDNETGS